MKELTYYVTKDGITPNEILDAGFAGEHNATRLIFNLSDELLEADEYYLHITNAGGEFFAIVCSDFDEGSIIFELSNRITYINGICKLQLVLKQNNAVIFSLPCQIKILPSAEGTSGAINYLSEISDALKICQNSAQKADKLIDMSQEFIDIVGDIDSALDEIIELENYYIGGEQE